jgi:hypothetical protein
VLSRSTAAFILFSANGQLRGLRYGIELSVQAVNRPQRSTLICLRVRWSTALTGSRGLPAEVSEQVSCPQPESELRSHDNLVSKRTEPDPARLPNRWVSDATGKASKIASPSLCERFRRRCCCQDGLVLWRGRRSRASWLDAGSSATSTRRAHKRFPSGRPDLGLWPHLSNSARHCLLRSRYLQ